MSESEDAREVTAICPHCGGATQIDPEFSEQICSICSEIFYDES